MIDLAFLIEGREESELPEVVCGCVRLSRIDAGHPIIVTPQAGVDYKLGTTDKF